MNIVRHHMDTPDNGVEIGWIKGTGMHSSPSATAPPGPPHQQRQAGEPAGEFVESRWRAGLAANFNDSTPTAAARPMRCLAALRTGPIAWLAEADYVDDHSLPAGRAATEAARRAARGQLLTAARPQPKVTYEYLDPDRDVANDQQNRWSVVYECTPIQFVQLRGGARLYDGIPQQPVQNLRLYFLELHGFFRLATQPPRQRKVHPLLAPAHFRRCLRAPVLELLQDLLHQHLRGGGAGRQPHRRACRRTIRACRSCGPSIR